MMIKRTWFLVVALGALAVAARLTPPKVAPSRTEEWMESVLPTSIPGFVFQSSGENPSQSYRVPQTVYDKLQPYGIVARVFVRGDVIIDTMVVAGNDRNAFHDPNACFPSQDWAVVSNSRAKLKTTSRGEFDVSILTVRDTDVDHLTLFFYRGPTGIHATQNELYADWFRSSLQLQDAPEGAFFRFMVMRGDMKLPELLKFAGSFLDAADQASAGIL